MGARLQIAVKRQLGCISCAGNGLILAPDPVVYIPDAQHDVPAVRGAARLGRGKVERRRGRRTVIGSRRDRNRDDRR